MKILFLGDVMGRAGRAAVTKTLPTLRDAWGLDFVVINGENATSGAGLSPDHAKALFDAGADCVTLGDHAFDQRDMLQYIETESRILRPLNFAKGAPGRGAALFPAAGGRKVLVAQVLGQVFMKRPFDDPFSHLDKILRAHPRGGQVAASLIDIHCEATSEKMGVGHYCDGRASVVVGTHTHVPTADAQILPGGTAFQSDAGMCGDYDSVIGMEKAEPLRRFVTGMSKGRFTPALGAATLSGLYVETDNTTGAATRVEMVRQGGRLAASCPRRSWPRRSWPRRPNRPAWMSERVRLLGILLLMGIGWGLTQPLSKIAVSEEYRHVGLIFWQLLISAVVLGLICAIRGRSLPLTKPALITYGILALLGTLLPNAMSYEVARHLPAGWLSVVISTVPLAAFPMAILLGTDRFSWSRLTGLLAGLAGVICLALPVQAWLTGTAAPDALAPGMLIWVAAGLIAPILYAMEGNYVAKWGLGDLDPLQALYGASVLGALVAAPIALAMGEWIDPRPPWGAPDVALVLSSLIHAVVYTTYVWLVGRAGAVFASQVSYVVTGAGVVWAILLLGERYGAGFWLATILMFLGLFLVQPRHQD